MKDAGSDRCKDPLDSFQVATAHPRDLVAPNFRVYELTRSDLAIRQGIDNGFETDAQLRAAVHLAREVLQPLRDAFGSFTPNSVFRGQRLARGLERKPSGWISPCAAAAMSTPSPLPRSPWPRGRASPAIRRPVKKRSPTSTASWITTGPPAGSPPRWTWPRARARAWARI